MKKLIGFSNKYLGENMSNYKSIGAQSTFISPQPWVFRPVKAFRLKIYSTIVLLLTFIYFFIISVNFLRNRPHLENSVIIATITIIIYFCIALVALHIYFNSIEYQVHGTEIVIKKGLINITENHIPFSNITNIAIRQGPLDRIYGIGTVIIYTGGAKLNSSRKMGQIRGTRIFADVGYFILNQIKDFETFFTYMLGESFQPKSKLNKEFLINFLNLCIDIKNNLEKTNNSIRE